LLVNNVLVQLILARKIGTFAELKSAYHKLIMRTHPDAVGSDMHLERYLRLTRDYEEARARLSTSGHAQSNSKESERINNRLAFFQQLHLVESLEIPYAFPPEENAEQLILAKKSALENLLSWRKDLAELYVNADKEYAGIKKQKPMGPYLKHALALNIRPLMHDLIGYHLTGRDVYAKQAKQNLSGIMHQLTEKGCIALREFLSLLLDDMKNGAAVLE
jgi:hypothetical protein